MKTNESRELLSKWGVYKITNIENGDSYIGSTIESFAKRMGKHMSSYHSVKRGKIKTCPHLYDAFEKYGIDNFKFSILKYFNRKKDSSTNKRIATYLEEKLIQEFKPRYNICKKPTLSGCPNLGRKLSEEWKRKIGEKSKLYKHKNNQENYLKKSQQNKDSSSLYRVYKDTGEEIIGTCMQLYKQYEFTNIHRWILGTAKSNKGWKVQKISSQKKKIRIFDKKESKIFNSFGQCDKYLNMWRGFTSTQVVNNKNKILDYNYKVL